MEIHNDKLNEILQRSAEGYIGAHEAATMALEMGTVLVGTAVSMEAHRPTVPLCSDSGRWETVLPDNEPWQAAFHATTSERVAIWSSFGGNVNVPFQRMHSGARPILPESSRCDLGTFGWDVGRHGMSFRLHPHIPPMVEHLSNETEIGRIDLVARQSDMKSQKEAPGNVFLFHEAPILGSLVVRMGDVRQVPFNTEFFERRYHLNGF